MEKKEHRKKMADLTADIGDIDDTVDQINVILGEMVADDVQSDIGQMMFLFNPVENVYIAGAAPLVIQQAKAPEGEEQPPLQMVGMNIQFVDNLLMKETISSSFTMHHGMLIRALTALKKDLGKEQKKLDLKLDELITQKKASPD